MKPFNLQRALAGDAVITRDGRTPTQITYFSDIKNTGYKLYAVLDGGIVSYNSEGKYCDIKQNREDLFMVSDQKEFCPYCDKRKRNRK